jgi:hypothetical protein
VKNVLILSAYFCTVGLVTFCGILMLIGSDRAIELLSRLLRVDGFSENEPNQTRSSGFQSRLGGLLMAAIGFFMLALPIYWMADRSTSPQAVLYTGPMTTALWPAIGPLFVAFAIGAFLVLSPRVIVPLSKFFMPNRVFPSRPDARAILVVRLIGFSFVAFSIYGAFVEFH